MASSLNPDYFELGDYLGVLRRRWWVVLVSAALGTLVAAAFLTVTPKTYTATATVYVSANAANANQLQGSRTSGAAVNMDNEAQIVQSDLVAGPAAKALRSSVPLAQLIKQLTVTVPANTTVLDIACTASSARASAACAQAFANSYLAARAAAARGKVGFEVSELQSRERTLESQVLKLRQQLRSLRRNSPKRPLISTQIKNADSQLSTLRADISALGGSVNYNPGNILTAAIAPTAPSSPQPLLDLPSGLVAGLLIGLVLAFVTDRRDDLIHSAADVERFLRLPVLLSLPHRRFDEVSSLASPRSQEGQAFTELAEAVGAGLGDGNHIIAVAASSPGHAGSLVAANLAAALARTRSDVLLVCADPQDIIMRRLLGVGDRRGLADVLAGQATLGEATWRVPEVARLRLLTPGATTSALAEQFGYDINQGLMTDLRRLARYVILEVRAAGEGAETFGLAEFADTALVVVEVSSSSKSDVANCLARLDRMRTGVMGTAVLPAVRRVGKTRPVKPQPVKPARSAGRTARTATSPGQQTGATSYPGVTLLPGSQAGTATSPGSGTATSPGSETGTTPLPGSGTGSQPGPQTAPEDPAQAREVAATSASPGPGDQHD